MKFQWSSCRHLSHPQGAGRRMAERTAVWQVRHWSLVHRFQFVILSNVPSSQEPSGGKTQQQKSGISTAACGLTTESRSQTNYVCGASWSEAQVQTEGNGFCSQFMMLCLCLLCMYFSQRLCSAYGPVDSSRDEAKHWLLLSSCELSSSPLQPLYFSLAQDDM